MRKKIGIREFREHFAKYLEGDDPVTVTRHGEPVGFYIPVPRKRATDAELEALRIAGEKLDAAIAAAGTTEDELMRDIEHIRAQERKRRKAG
ncbi:MAG TPA: type II toxin-antitoxin system prevent-host-death family antitoxin [Bryobacteraceae bacterium]|jgi:antitoxin (DNA-binding transcriptional repressor) of toxin-antitoxin stability system